MSERLEIRCDICNGRGSFVNGLQGEIRCDVCKGAGYLPTQLGAKILDLVRHNLRLMLEDSRR